MPPDASAPPPRQLPLPYALPTALPTPPPPVPCWTRPEQVWRSLSPEVQQQIRQTWLRVLREVIDDGGKR
jgi:hypothetical protein